MGGTCMAICITEVVIRGWMIAAYKSVHVCHTPLLWSGGSSHIMYRLGLGGRDIHVLL